MFASLGKAPVLAIILISYLMIVLDISIVITGLPKIQQSLNLFATTIAHRVILMPRELAQGVSVALLGSTAMLGVAFLTVLALVAWRPQPLAQEASSWT